MLNYTQKTMLFDDLKKKLSHYLENRKKGMKDIDKKTKKNFTFSDPRQERIYKKLLEIGPGPAAFFKDACRMWEEEPPLASKTHLIAHSLREIESSVREVMLPLDYKATQEIIDSKQTHRDQIKVILDFYQIDPNSEIAKLWMKIADKEEEITLSSLAHRNSLDSPRALGSSFEELWSGMQALLDMLLSKMETKFIGYISTLDKLLIKPVPSAADLHILKNRVPHSAVTFNYFFEKLDHPEWLTPLKDEGFFNNPPPPQEHLDGGLSYPFWSQALYLKKIANITEKQDEILSICLAISTDNIAAKRDLLDIALILPPEKSVRLVHKFKSKVIDNLFTPEKYGELIKYLASSGKTAEALDLAKNVLDLKPDPRETPKYEGYKFPHEPISIIREHSYEHILQKDFPVLVDSARIEAIKVLLNLISKYVTLSDTERDSDSKDDYSEIWRSAIEDHSQNHRYGVRDLIINGIRDSCERFLTNNPEEMPVILKELESRKLFILHRIKIHLLRIYPQDSEKFIVEELMNKEEFSDKQRLTHEYFLLAETHGVLLNKEQRGELWSWIQNGVTIDKEAYYERCKERGTEPSEEEIDKHNKSWQMYHLLPFKDIEPEWQEYYKELVKICGEPEFPAFRSWSGGSSFGYNSALTNEQFNKMTPLEVVEYLKSWEPPEHDPLSSSREGTSRALSAQISNDPKKWESSLSAFNDLDPTFVRSAFTGYRDALKQDKRFDWKPILDLCKKILTKPVEVKNRTSSGFYGDDPDWSWSRNAILELISEGFLDTDGKMPHEFREDLWKIIESLTNEANPTPEEEAKQLEANRDPLTIAISSTRGKALQAAFKYGIWIKSSFPKDKQKDWTLAKNAPELLEIMNAHLDINIDSSLGIRALYGEKLGNLTWLDFAWVEEHIKLIFPDDLTAHKYFVAAWESFINFNNAYDDLFPLIYKQYERAIKEIGANSENEEHPGTIDMNLTQHLILFFCRGKIPLETGLLKDFYDTAPLELKAEVIDFIGRSVKDNDVSDPLKEQFVALLENRLKVVKSSDNIPLAVQEFKDFSWWIYSEKFNTKWSLNKLIQILELGCDIEGDHLVLENFMTLAKKYPLEVITCIDLMVENDKNGWGVPTWGDELSRVIKIVLESKDNDSITKTKEFIHKLVAKGHSQYIKLLPKESK